MLVDHNEIYLQAPGWRSSDANCKAEAGGSAKKRQTRDILRRSGTVHDWEEVGDQRRRIRSAVTMVLLRGPPPERMDTTLD